MTQKRPTVTFVDIPTFPWLTDEEFAKSLESAKSLNDPELGDCYVRLVQEQWDRAKRRGTQQQVDEEKSASVYPSINL